MGPRLSLYIGCLPMNPQRLQEPRYLPKGGRSMYPPPLIPKLYGCLLLPLKTMLYLHGPDRAELAAKTARPDYKGVLYVLPNGLRAWNIAMMFSLIQAIYGILI